MANELKLENPLSSDRKPVKVGNDSTGILLADNEVYIENDANVGGDLTVNGSITTETGTNILDGSTSIRTAQTHEAGIILTPTGLISIGEPAIGTGAIAALGYGLTNQSKLVLYSRQDVGDVFQIVTTTNGATYISTADDDGTNANLSIDVDGSITLNSFTGAFIAENNGTEFSAANSAYAGMILGYTRLQGDLTSSHSYEIQNSMTVEDSTHQITFKTPPSEKVEIEVTCLIDVLSTDTSVDIGLSDSDTYNKLGEQFEYDTVGVIFSDDEADDHIVVSKFVLEAAQLASVGSSNTFYIGFSTSGATKTAYLKYGLRASHNLADHPFVIKATALPATIYDGQ